MENKKFDEMMESYARSTSKGMDHDLHKMRLAEHKPRKNIKRKWTVAVCSVVLSVAICLAVVLPLTLGMEQDGGETMQYYFSDAEYMRDVPFTSIDDIAGYGTDFMLPTISNTGSTGMLKMNDSTGTLGGIMLEVSVYDDYFDYISILMYYENYVYVESTLFDVCVDVALWNGITVGYNINERASGVYDWRIRFNREGVNYYMTFVFYGDAEVDAILDMIF